MAYSDNIRERKLPEIEIAGTKFYVDAISMGLVEARNSENWISMFDMISLDDHHEFVYDKERKNIKEGRWDESQDADQSRFEYVWLRRIESLDPDGMRILEQNGTIAAFNRNLPVVNIAGVDFYWDARKAEFSEVSNVWNKIYRNDLMKENDNLGFYFDTQKHHTPFPHELESYKSLLRMSQHIVFVELSNVQKKLSAEKQQDPDLLLKRNRVQENRNRGKGIR